MHRLIRWLDRLLFVLPLGLSALAVWWVMETNPFARPFVERSVESAEAALARAMARKVTPEWYARELEAALAEGDLDRVEVVALSGARQGIAPSDDQMARIEALEAEQTGFWATAEACGACMADIASCPSIRLMGTCALPFELSPAGDVNALWRAGMSWMAGEEIDRIDAGLAVAGLASTAAILVSGGSSVTVKAGTTALRLARRLGSLTERFAADLARLADVGLKPDRLVPFSLGRVPLEEVVDTARLSALTAVGADLARVAGNTSPAEAVVLLRHVDTAEDAARLARLSDVATERTRPVIEILGKGRAFRALVRLSDLALGAAALVWAAAGTALAFLGDMVGRMVLRGLRRGLRASSRRSGAVARTRSGRVEPPPLGPVA